VLSSSHIRSPRPFVTLDCQQDCFLKQAGASGAVIANELSEFACLQGAIGCALRFKQRKRRTRNLENVAPLLGFANDDLKFSPHRVAAASPNRAEHPYESCNRSCSCQRVTASSLEVASCALVAGGFVRRGSGVRRRETRCDCRSSRCEPMNLSPRIPFESEKSASGRSGHHPANTLVLSPRRSRQPTDACARILLN